MNTSESHHVAPYSTIAWIWTITYTMGLIFFGFRLGAAIVSGVFPDPVDLFFTLLLLIVVTYAWLRSVRSYSIEDEQLVITRSGMGRITIPLDDITGALADSSIGAFFNTSFMSTGGVFGWAGRARVRNPSDLRSLDADIYGTNPKFSVVLDLKNGRKAIVTPADPAALETALRVAGVGEQITDPRPRLNSTAVGDKPRPWLQGNKK